MNDEQAKAVQEVAKSSGQLIEATKKAGGFVAKIVGGASNQIGGVLEDNARLYRYKNLLSIADKVEAIHAQRRIEGKTIPIPLRTAIPMLDSAALEDDESLQEVWARLIANGIDPNFKAPLHPGYTEIIRQISPDEALILNSFLKIESYPTLFTNHVSEKHEAANHSFWWIMENKQSPSYEGIYQFYLQYCRTLPLKLKTGLRVYLDNLQRLKIIELGQDFSGEKKDIFSFIGKRSFRSASETNSPSLSIPARDEYLRMTAFGENFVEACISTNAPNPIPPS